jgi:hypothetical protein
MSSYQDLDEMVEEWTLAGFKPIGSGGPGTINIPSQAKDDITFKQVQLQLEYFSERFFSRFVPALYPPHSPSYCDRLVSWLNNDGLSPEHKRLLFEFALRIAFFSFEDFLQLYRTAFVGPVTRWIVDELGLSLQNTDFQSRLEEEKHRHTWYCPVTDSMVISEFYHANRITGIDQRPAFRPLKDFSDPGLLAAYMRSKGLTRLVLMEDFVGSGAQTSMVIHWAVDKLTCPVLFTPLIICPDGIKLFTDMAATYPARLRFEPVLTLDGSAFAIADGVTPDQLIARITDLAQAIHPSVAGIPDTSYGPFGFSKPGDKTKGATVVLFSNTPDNTLPLIHHHARHPSQWKALFPRVTRETA